MRKWLAITIKFTLACTTIGCSCAIAYGLCSIKAHNDYIDFDNNKNHKLDYGIATPKKTKWNVSSSESDAKTFPLTGDRKNYTELILDGSNHSILDKSFNQSAFKGEVNWGINSNWTPESNDPFPSDESLNQYLNEWKWNKPSKDDLSGFISIYSSPVESGIKSLILPGYLHQTPLAAFKQNDYNTYNKAGYILIDANAPDENVASVMFRADESAFLAGLSTCQYLSIDNYEHYHKKGDLKVGTFGGVAIPTVTIYMGGFQLGVNFFNKILLPSISQKNHWDAQTEKDHLVHFINLGNQDSFFSGTFTIGDGRSIVQELLARGANAIMPVAGPQTIDTVQEIKNQKSDCICVGVDTNQEASDMNDISLFTDSKGNNHIIKFSAEKDIARVTSSVLYLSSHGETKWSPSGSTDPIFGAYGYLTVGTWDVSSSACKVSEPGQDYFINLINNAFNVSYSTYADALSYILTNQSLNVQHLIDNEMYFQF